MHPVSVTPMVSTLQELLCLPPGMPAHVVRDSPKSRQQAEQEKRL